MMFVWSTFSISLWRKICCLFEFFCNWLLNWRGSFLALFSIKKNKEILGSKEKICDCLWEFNSHRILILKSLG